MKKLLIILSLTLLYGCDITKQASKRKTETSLTEGFEQREYRPADNIRYIPPANVVLRDTTIVVVSDKGTTLRMTYDSQGNVRETECLPALIDLVTKMTTQFEKSEKEKAKEKTEKFSDTWILYGFGAIVLLGSFAMFLFYRTINKNSKAIELILQKISN